MLYLDENGKFIIWLKIINSFMVFIGCLLNLDLVWSLNDLGMVFSIALNLYAIFKLRNIVIVHVY